jgi:hypothetical protein
VSGTDEDLRNIKASGVPGTTTLTDIARQVAIVIADENAEYMIGGWYARIEDIEMRRLTVDEIEWPSNKK